MRMIKGLVIALSIGIAGIFSVIFFSPSYIEIPMSVSENYHSIVEVNLNKKKLPLYLALGSKYPLSLTNEVLKEVPKREEGEAFWKSSDRGEETGPLFQISKLKLGGLTFNRLLTIPDSSISDTVAQGAITWPFERMNLLLDFPHRKICGIKDERCLKELGLDLQRAERVKCKVVRNRGVYLESSAVFSKPRVLLATTANANIIHSSLWDAGCLKTSLQIGNTDFGSQYFFPLSFDTFMETDAVLGVPFFCDHMVYIDAKNEVAYIGGSSANTFPTHRPVKLPIKLTADSRPLVEVEVDGKHYPMCLDTGSCLELAIFAEAFRSQKGEYTWTTQVFNFRGDEEWIDNYVHPKCRVGDVTLKSVVVSKEPEYNLSIPFSLTKPININFEKDECGQVGRPLLNRTNFYLDCPDRSLWFVNCLEDLEAVGGPLNSFEKIPFELEKSGICLKFESELGELEFLLDTGTGITLVKPECVDFDKLVTDDEENLVYVTNAFILGEHNFGRQRLFPLEMSVSSLGGIDGILGMDFLFDHPFYIDYPNRLIYIKRSAKPSPE